MASRKIDLSGQFSELKKTIREVAQEFSQQAREERTKKILSEIPDDLNYTNIFINSMRYPATLTNKDQLEWLKTFTDIETLIDKALKFINPLISIKYVIKLFFTFFIVSIVCQ